MHSYRLRFFLLLLCFALAPLHAAHATVDEIISLPLASPPFGLVDVPALDGEFTPIKWNLAEFLDGRIPFVINPVPPSGSISLPAVEEIRAAFEASFDAWEAVSTATVAFALEERSTPAPEIAFDGESVLAFARDDVVGPGTLGATLIYALDQDNDDIPFETMIDFVNEIFEADTVMNPDIAFTTDGNPVTFDLQGVVTHEIGHALGRDHTGLMHATMWATGDRGITRNRVLSPDDVAGISNIYPAGEAFTNAFGGISGAVLRGDAPVFGAHVVALDAQGLPLVSALTFPDGSYRIPGLPPGDYTLYVEPIDGPSNPPEYDLGVLFPPEPGFAGFDEFTTFLLEPAITVTAGLDVEAVNLSVTGTGSLNITGIAPVDPENFLPIKPSGIVLTQGETKAIQLTGTELTDGLSVSISGTGVAIEGELLFFGRNGSDPASTSSVEATLSVAADAVEGPRTIFVEKEGARAALSGGIVIGKDDGAMQQLPDGEITPLIDGEELAAIISVPGETDRYSFTGAAGQFVTVAMLATPTSRLDSMLELRTADGGVLSSADDTIGLSAVLRDVRLPSDGEYLIIGSGFLSSTGGYTILLTLADSPAGFDMPVGSLALGEVVGGSLAEPGELQTWTLTGAGGELVTIMVNGADPFDPMVELFDGDFVRLGSDDDSGAGTNALLEGIRLPSDGAVFIRISGALGTVGDYTLSVASAANDSDDPFAMHLRLNAPSFQLGDRIIATLTTAGMPATAVDLYLVIVLPDGAVAYAVPEAEGSFMTEESPLEPDSTVDAGPTELLNLIIPAVPAGDYAVIAAYVTAGAAPTLTTIQALDVALFEIE